MYDWEDVPISPIYYNALLRNKWADEDVDENDVKDLWEDEDVDGNDMNDSREDEEEPTPATPPVTVPPAEKNTRLEKAGSKKEKTAEAEKFRQQRLVEEVDPADFFSKRSDKKSLDDFILKTESDFSKYAELISLKLWPYEKSYHYMILLKKVMRLLTVALTAADVKEIASSVMTILIKKLMEENKAIEGEKKTDPK